MDQLRLKALVVASSSELLGVWRRSLNELAIFMDESRTASDAADKLARNKYEALAVDCDSIRGSAGLFMAIRSAPTSHHAVVFAIASPARSRGLNAYGVNFILTSPLNGEWLGRCLRASYGSMMADHRRYFRYPVRIAVAIEFSGRRFAGAITNLSEGGAGIQVEGLPANAHVLTLDFVLPDSGVRIEASGSVVWADGNGRAGLRFENLLPSKRAHLMQWLSTRFVGSPHSLAAR